MAVDRQLARFPKYLFAESGDVISHVFIRPAVLVPGRRGLYWGYTLLDANSKHCHVYQHRVIAEAFHGPCPKGMECMHKDGNRANNAADNLEWGTRKQNHFHKRKHGTHLCGQSHPLSVYTEKQVLEMRKMARGGIPTQVALKKFGISRMNHWRIVNYQLWTHLP